MISIRKSLDRGHTKNEWLKSYHTFSFDEYHDPKFMHFNYLRVINEDYIKAGNGFHPHSHQDMEIMTYLISGELSHKDSLGNNFTIKADEVQFMRAGSGITHSEFNYSKEIDTHLLQIWVMPNQKGLTPTYSQQSYTAAKKKDELCLLADSKGTDGVFKIAQNVSIYSLILDANSTTLEHLTYPSHNLWIQIVNGNLSLNKNLLFTGDGAAVSDETLLTLSTNNEVELLLFDFDT